MLFRNRFLQSLQAVSPCTSESLQCVLEELVSEHNDFRQTLLVLNQRKPDIIITPPWDYTKLLQCNVTLSAQSPQRHGVIQRNVNH